MGMQKAGGEGGSRRLLVSLHCARWRGVWTERILAQLGSPEGDYIGHVETPYFLPAVVAGDGAAIFPIASHKPLR